MIGKNEKDDGKMNADKQEVLSFVAENDIKFVRLAFSNILGHQKNISVLSGELLRAVEEGIPFDASAVMGYGTSSHGDLFLVPDLGTMSILPWRPSTGRVIRFFCDVIYPDGTPYESDSRYILRKAVERSRSLGIIPEIGTELEFYLFSTDERGEPALPFDNGGYFDIAPFDKGENVRREICLTLEQMGIMPEASHHEEGPGQNEIDFRYSGALESADNVMTFKSVVRTVASHSGLYASFSPKPIANKSGSGFHINISLRDGVNEVSHSVRASFMAGVMERICEMTAFLNPTKQSYNRLGEDKAPKYVSWSEENRNQLIRIPAVRSRMYSRLELRSPDCTANPYLALALIINAGLDGIEKQLPLPSVSDNKHTHEDLERLPESLDEAVAAAKKSAFVRGVLGDVIVDSYTGAASDNR